uniref:Prohibitin n=2 Tax=Neobodo designis TaxID=312471 RepID=A0A7S1LU49_NEODS|eukprot:CAMPEP_0174854242 /NCGR_PEP_ID=MMETSP1114-20130205/30518_1 /TAXON_ID=312471 /ORGANISM="Neobodo designis, Strain CCAP 1951/1" /LENGTH=304 /DNA_ID=CAMNT_0016088925 /DNA_START=37 /DNA_END=951 /DNA_ORIENTATION=+
MCDDDDDCCCGFGWKGVAVGVVVFIGCLLTVILVPMSLKTVEFDEIAVDYNKVTRSIDQTPLEEGLHDVGPAGKLIKFKTTQQVGQIDDLETLTADSIEVELDVIVLYSIERQEVFEIIDKFGDQDAHDAFIRQVCENTIRQVAQGFTAKQFYLQRHDFQLTLIRVLTQLLTDVRAHAKVDSVQVVSVDLPPRVLSAMEASILAEQDIQNAEAERITQLQAASIALALANSEARLVQIAAERDVALTQQEALQAVLSERATMQARTDAFRNVSTELGYGGEFFLDSYLKYLVAVNNAGDTIFGV